MVHRFRQAQLRQREERQKKVNAVKPHFDRLEKVMSMKYELEASKNYSSLNNYIRNQQKQNKNLRDFEKDKRSILSDKRIKSQEQIQKNLEKRKMLQKEYLSRCKEYNKQNKKRQDISAFLESQMKQDTETLREMNRLRQDDVRENRAINKNKAMTIKAHIIKKQLQL